MKWTPKQIAQDELLRAMEDAIEKAGYMATPEVVGEMNKNLERIKKQWGWTDVIGGEQNE